MYKFLSWITVILWMTLTFYLSHQPATESNELSTGITMFFVETIKTIVPSMEFDLIDFNHLIRKSAHFINYLVLGILVLNALKVSTGYGCRSAMLALLICVLYAISDEVHQLFVPGRGAQVKDVLIDSAGSIVGIGVYLLIIRMINHFKAR